MGILNKPTEMFNEKNIKPTTKIIIKPTEIFNKSKNFLKEGDSLSNCTDTLHKNDTFSRLTKDQKQFIKLSWVTIKENINFEAKSNRDIFLSKMPSEIANLVCEKIRFLITKIIKTAEPFDADDSAHAAIVSTLLAETDQSLPEKSQ